MTDPVDTDAPQTWRACAEVFDQVPRKTNGHVVAARYLRAAANEVDRLRAEADDAYRSGYALGREHSKAKAETRLLAVIENAPHAPGCGFGGTFAVPHGDPRPDGGPIPCSCWKKDEQ